MNMNLIKRLLLTLILGMIVAGPATPIFKSFFGVGSSIAYAQPDDQGENDDDQGDNDNQ
jgi:hypothetical protein